MKKKIITLIISMILILPMIIPVSAAIIPDSTLDLTRRGSLYIKYMELTELEEPVVGAEFTIYKVGDINSDGSYASLIKDIDSFNNNMDMNAVAEKTMKAYESEVENGVVYEGTTSGVGVFNINDMDLGLYLIVETKPAIEHFPSDPFFAEVPYTEDNAWIYEVFAEPKPRPAGDLVIDKTVTGKDGEKNREFHFVVSFTDFSDPVHYKKSTGEEGEITSGQVITLKDGQNVRLDTIPAGKGYEVYEQEANSEGYITTSSGTTGIIKRRIVSEAHFNNSKSTTVDTGDSYKFLIAGGIALIAVIVVIILIIIRELLRV